jgi:sialate O-acetylesterase
MSSVLSAAPDVGICKRKALSIWNLLNSRTDTSVNPIWKHKMGVLRTHSSTIDSKITNRLYNSMIHPLRNYGIRALSGIRENLTQGSGSKLYESHLIDLDNDLRTQWNKKNLPFLIEQLANNHQRSKVPRKSATHSVREANQGSLQLRIPSGHCH